ncbi:MAG: hypothetical protein JW703_00775, partial [Candidatus Diapherotrites archaeon]|nr:hypothetical protein [Candidatus Diapherotrites archaeon]
AIPPSLMAQKRLDKGDGIALGAVSGLVLAISFGFLMIIASFFITAINMILQGRAEASGIDVLLTGFGIVFYLVIGFLGALPSAIVGAISGWFFERRWRAEKVEIINK